MRWLLMYSARQLFNLSRLKRSTKIVLLILLAIAITFFPVSQVFAASAYDDVIEVTDDYTIIRGEHEMDVLTSWGGLVQDCDNWSGSSGYYTINCETFNEYFDDTLENGSGWSVSFLENAAGTGLGDESLGSGDRVLVLNFNKDAGAYGGFNEVFSGLNRLSLYGSETTYILFLLLDDDGSVKVSNVTSGTGNSNVARSNPSYSIYKLAFANFPITYPEGYEGVEPPETPDVNDTVYPDFKYTVEDQRITATYNKNIPTTETCTNVVWSIARLNDENEIVDGTLQFETLPVNEPFVFDVYTYNTYLLGIQDLQKPIPCAPLPDDIEIEPKVITLEIDGSNFSGNTATSECSEIEGGSFCEPESPYEDCSTYGTDLIGGIGCHIRNFGVFLKILLTTLFVPSPRFFREYFDDTVDLVNEKLGFLVWPVEFTVEFFNAFFDGLDGTLSICNWSFGNVFGNDFKLNFCSFEQQFPTPFNTARYIIQAFTVFILIAGLHREYRRKLEV